MTASPTPSPTPLPDATFRVTADEQRAGRLAQARLAQAIHAYRTLGYVVVEDCLPPELLAEVRDRYLEALARKVARSGLPPVAYYDDRGERNDRVQVFFQPEGGNHDLNRWNMHLPSAPPFFDDRLLANAIAMQIIDAVLGADCILDIIASDTPYPSSGFQNIHQDNLLHRIALNVALCDFTEDNAPIEVWPRTHVRDPDRPLETFEDVNALPPAQLAERARRFPSRRLLLRAGSFLIRDQRLIHRGTANRSAAPRPMLTLLYLPPPPHGVPFLPVTYALTAAALRVRETARRLPRGKLQMTLLNYGNHVGRYLEFWAATDRDYRRRIPAALWAALSPRARELLRYAAVEGGPPGPGVRTTAGATARLLIDLASVTGLTALDAVTGRPNQTF